MFVIVFFSIIGAIVLWFFAYAKIPPLTRRWVRNEGYSHGYAASKLGLTLDMDRESELFKENFQNFYPREDLSAAYNKGFVEGNTRGRNEVDSAAYIQQENTVKLAKA